MGGVQRHERQQGEDEPEGHGQGQRQEVDGEPAGGRGGQGLRERGQAAEEQDGREARQAQGQLYGSCADFSFGFSGSGWGFDDLGVRCARWGMMTHKKAGSKEALCFLPILGN